MEEVVELSQVSVTLMNWATHVLQWESQKATKMKVYVNL